MLKAVTNKKVGIKCKSHKLKPCKRLERSLKGSPLRIKISATGDKNKLTPK